MAWGTQRRMLFWVLKLIRTYLTDKVYQVCQEVCPEIFFRKLFVREKDWKHLKSPTTGVG